MHIVFYGNYGVDYSSESHHAKSLESLGHTVTRLQEPKVHAKDIEAEALKSDLFCWVKTHGWHTDGDMIEVLRNLRVAGIPSITYHLDLYRPIPERWAQYKDDPYMLALDHFFTVDAQQADWLNANTDVKGHYLPPGVYGAECYPTSQPSPWANDVVFVGSRGYHSGHKHRQLLLDHLERRYGPRFTRCAGDAHSGTIRGDELNRLYSNSKIVVGDTYCTPWDGKPYNYPNYWSDRLPESLGRNAFLAMPYVRGMEQHFTDGEHLVFWKFGDFDALDAKIDYYLEHDDEREKIRRAGHEHVKANHTYKHRWQTILDTVFG